MSQDVIKAVGLYEGVKASVCRAARHMRDVRRFYGIDEPGTDRWEFLMGIERYLLTIHPAAVNTLDAEQVRVLVRIIDEAESELNFDVVLAAVSGLAKVLYPKHDGEDYEDYEERIGAEAKLFMEHEQKK